MLSGSVLSLCEWRQYLPPGAGDEKGRIHMKLSAPCLAHSKQPIKIAIMSIMQFTLHISSVAQSCLALCNPMDCSTLDFPVHHQLPSLLKLMFFESMMPSNHLILCCPLLLLPQSFAASGSFLVSQFTLQMHLYSNSSFRAHR